MPTISNETKDRRFMEDPMEWPKWPVLPLKRRTGNYNTTPDFCGFLFGDKKPVVYLHTIYGLGGKDDKTWADVLKPLRTEQYASLDELVKVWEVD